MKNEKKSLVKAKTKEKSMNKSVIETEKEQQNETRMLIEESPTANITVRLENSDMLSKYRVKNPNIKIGRSKGTTNLAANDLSDDDEIWICELPATINVNKLIGKSIKLNSRKSSIQTGDGEFEFSSSKFENSSSVYQNRLSLVLQNKDSQFSIKNINPAGRMALHAKIDNREDPIELTPTDRPECTIFPENLTARHPLFGRNFDEKIKVNEAVQKRLNEAQATTPGEVQHITRIKQEKDKSSTQESPKKMKKRKLESVDDSEVLTKPKQKIKIENHDDDDLDRIKLIFEKK